MTPCIRIFSDIAYLHCSRQIVSDDEDDTPLPVPPILPSDVSDSRCIWTSNFNPLFSPYRVYIDLELDYDEFPLTQLSERPPVVSDQVKVEDTYHRFLNIY